MTLRTSTAKAVKYVLGLTGFVALSVGYLAIPGKLNWYLALVLVYGSALWPYLVLVTVEMLAVYAGVSSPYQTKFYNEIKNDLKLAGIGVLAFIGVYSFGPTAYGATSFDIFGAAVPFLAASFFTIRRITKLKLMDQPMKGRYRNFILVMISCVCALCFWLATRVVSSHFNLIASTWIQITIFSVSVFFYVESRRVEHVLKVGHIELSPVLLAIFGNDGSYAQIEPIAERWNRAVAQHKQKASRHAKKRKRKPSY